MNSCSSSGRTCADDKTQAVIDRTTRSIVAAGGQIVKVAPWGRRRLAYPIDRHREGSYHIILFEAPAEAIVELERSAADHRRGPPPPRDPRRAAGQGRPAATTTADDGSRTRIACRSTRTRTRTTTGELIDESESEAAPAAID